MATRCTEQLREQLLKTSSDVVAFAAEFDAWKALGEKGEYGSFLFGKDGSYARPKVDDKPYLLRHVHLAPIKDVERLTLWQKLWRLRTRKTSNRVLVYASDSKGNHLLIFILEEPSAHAIAEMKSSEDRAVMERFAEIAAAFLHDGTILP